MLELIPTIIAFIGMIACYKWVCWRKKAISYRKRIDYLETILNKKYNSPAEQITMISQSKGKTTDSNTLGYRR